MSCKTITVLLCVVLLVFIVYSEPSAETRDIQTRVPKNKSEVPRISSKDLINSIYKGEAVLIVDVRSVQEYEAKHIVGAISVPLDQVEFRMDEFPRDSDIVFY